MSQPEPANAKADQIAHKFFNKFALVVTDARATAPGVPQPRPKVDKWFNLETNETDAFREALRPYRSLSSGSLPPPLLLSVLLIIPELNNGEVVVFNGGPHRTPVHPTPSSILLEQWSLDFQPAQGAQAEDIPLATVYKHAIATFRSIYTLLRVLPAWRIHKRASRRSRNSLGIEVVVGQPSGSRVLAFGVPLSPTALAIPTTAHAFAPVAHPSGSLAISLRYLSSAEFSIDALESLLSSRFMQQEATPSPDPTRALEFTPTVMRHRTDSQHQAGSLGSSPGSLPPRQAPGQRPSSALVSRAELDRFLVNAPGSQGSVAFPSSSQPQSSQPQQFGSVPSQHGSGLSPKLAMLKLDDAGSVRSRRDSAGTGVGGLPMERAASADVASPSPVHRRPSINAIHPFKSGTLSGSFQAASSLRQNSPLPTITASSTMSRATPSPLTPARPSYPITVQGLSSSPSSVSPVGTGFTRPSPPGAAAASSAGITRPSPPNPGMSRPSPPYTPSSLAERRSLGGASSSSDPSTSLPHGAQPSTSYSHRRISSTFSHRYSTPPVAAPSSSHPTDDLGAFVQAIDSREPLRHAREVSENATDERALRAGAIPTTQGEVRDQLAAMHAQFHASLEGIEQRRRTASQTDDDTASAPAPSPFRAPQDPPRRPLQDPPPRPPGPFRVPEVPVRPPLLRRDSGGSPLAAGSSAQRRDSSDSSPAAGSRPPAQRRDSGDSPFSAQPRRESTESPFRRAAAEATSESPFRDSDDNASDRGSLQLRWRPRLGSAGGGGGTDSEGERGASGSDLIGGRMEL
ncbi:hypothetical protein AURDEDRAFT_115310 [Auricularia subglabra TFB-10046 SS5]|nr:hypothetical protein AURDEDRAFT_115310 [Auricularia subglabra TFB-10046 SS5]